MLLLTAKSDFVVFCTYFLLQTEIAAMQNGQVLEAKIYETLQQQVSD